MDTEQRKKRSLSPCPDLLPPLSLQLLATASLRWMNKWQSCRWTKRDTVISLSMFLFPIRDLNSASLPQLVKCTFFSVHSHAELFSGQSDRVRWVDLLLRIKLHSHLLHLHCVTDRAGNWARSQWLLFAGEQQVCWRQDCIAALCSLSNVPANKTEAADLSWAKEFYLNVESHWAPIVGKLNGRK